jgi:sulfoxide reductase heme-binding subunit YedZ
MHRFLTSAWTKAAAFLLCLEPLAELVVRQYRQDLGANPVEYITHQTGTWALRFLALTLATSPARKLLALPDLIRFRRMLGLYAFFFAYLHLTTYVWLDKFFDFGEMWKDVWKRPFITAGVTAFLLMLPLALTSTGGWIRRLGGRRWQMLHRLVYGSAIAGVIHYYWLVKSDVRAPLTYAAIFAVLFLLRLPFLPALAGKKI